MKIALLDVLFDYHQTCIFEIIRLLINVYVHYSVASLSLRAEKGSNIKAIVVFLRSYCTKDHRPFSGY